ncbi:MAG: hypothetical protein GX552_03840 [Chloroflexi bacterium]|jgi:hypothetical protein|nr:hypothetical protein [Chloroflexota bacterium]
MRTFTKILVLGLLVLLLAGCGKNNTAAARVARAASKIADFDLPEGYKADFAADLLAYSVVAYAPSEGHGHLYLIQSEREEDGRRLDSALGGMLPGNYDVRSRMKVLERRPISVRGHETTLIITEGVNANGDTYRQAVASFPGKGGPAVVVISELIDGWDETVVEAFIESLR